jgi:hypothetical protein
MTGDKVCRICGEVKSLSEFHRATGARDGHRGECKSCGRARMKAYYRKDPQAAIDRAKRWQAENRERYLASQRRHRRNNKERLRAEDRKRWLKAKYGMTPQDFDGLLEKQGHKCAICGQPGGKDLHVDHDHQVNEVRGLLCGKCNKAIGLFNEDSKTVRAAENYLTDWRLKPYREITEEIEKSALELLG